MIFCWYCPFPTRWIRCEIITNLLGRITIETHDGERVSGLSARSIADAVLCEAR